MTTLYMLMSIQQVSQTCNGILSDQPNMCIEPAKPIGFNITGESYTVSDVTVIFEWNLPQGSGPQVVVDYYRISITPAQLFPDSSVSHSLTWNATLDYNTTYTANITAINCAGESETYLLPYSFEYS